MPTQKGRERDGERKRDGEGERERETLSHSMTSRRIGECDKLAIFSQKLFHVTISVMSAKVYKVFQSSKNEHFRPASRTCLIFGPNTIESMGV